jgi:hypothetical protein
MDSLRSVLASYAARWILILAIVTIHAMRWLYNQGLMRKETTEQFFHCAKLLEDQADRLTKQEDM